MIRILQVIEVPTEQCYRPIVIYISYPVPIHYKHARTVQLAIILDQPVRVDSVAILPLPPLVNYLLHKTRECSATPHSKYTWFTTV